MKRTAILMVAAVWMLSLGACGSRDAGSDTETEKADEKAVAKKAEPASSKSAAGDREPEGKVVTEGPKPVGDEKLSASHILVMHTESQRKPPSITRTKEEARALADELSGKLAGGADFAELAKEYSDCPSGKAKGGDLGIFPAGRMAPEFTAGVRAIGVGEVSKPVESPFGYHIIKRQEVQEVHARHILVMHADSKRKPASVTRTKEEARKLIEDLAAKLAGGADFAELAKENSDCPSGKRKGGDLGSFGKGMMAPPFEEAAFALEENKISEIVETDFGYHIIQRLP